MSTPAKYMFDTPLDAPSAPPPVAFDDVELLKTAHTAELERVRAMAYDEGFDKGRAEAEQSGERALYKELNQLVDNKEIFQAEIDARLAAARHSSILLAMTIARKLSGSLLERYPARHIENFFRDSLALLPQKASLRLIVAPDLADSLQPRLEALLERNGQENVLQVLEDEDITGVNCRLLWNDGGIEQDTETIYATIEKMIETCLYTDAPTGPVTRDPGKPPAANLPEPVNLEASAPEPAPLAATAPELTTPELTTPERTGRTL